MTQKMSHEGFIDHVLLDGIFRSISTKSYVVVRCPTSFPKIPTASDLDLYVKEDLAEFLNALENVMVENAAKLIPISPSQVQIDFMKNGHLYLKLDLYTSLPEYKLTPVNPFLFHSCVNSSLAEWKSCCDCDFQMLIKEPDEFHSFFLRMLEFKEWFPTDKPSKMKHADLVESFVASLPEEKKAKFMGFVSDFLKTPTSPFGSTNALIQNASLLRALEVLGNKNSELNAQIDSQLSQLENLGSTNSDLMATNSELNAQIDSQLSQLENLGSTNSDLMATNSELNALINIAFWQRFRKLWKRILS
jgi:hypothetical protein